MRISATAPLVFVVDDEPEVRAFVCESLEHAGYRTRALDSAESALRLVAVERPDLLIVDIYLALHDLDGFTLASRLREQAATAHTPILFITGMDAPVHRALSHGLRALYLQKPFTATELIRIVAATLPAPDRGG
jgi:DNA-binding response OmpR family regulator